MSRFATSSDVLLWYPALSAVSEPLMAAALEQSKCMFDPCAWGCHLLMGHIHATAHALLMQQGAGSTGGGAAAGPVSSMSMGPVSISYASSSSGDGSSWALTGAGQQFLALQGQLGSQAFVPQGQGCCPTSFELPRLFYPGGCC